MSELGQIAGMGMLIAYITSITVLPALLYVLHPPGEQETLGIAALAPVDDFLERYRIPIIAATLGVAIAGLPLLYFLRFDFNPMNLRSATVESVATYLDLRRDPATGANSINVLVRLGGGGRRDGPPAQGVAAGRHRQDHRHLRPRRSGGQARPDRRGGEGARSGAGAAGARRRRPTRKSSRRSNSAPAT